ncbi:hypothetical protein IHE26_08545 [Plesiomonas shigelloides]|uniref:hypothetical protein n=1 Tax=Plesiomonas shigelloides TaxID=703 RepID=UPI001780ACC2|nr:hypothetical protein [Plesiomonas shigelloides]QOH78516.1 hypothetical protein IHE26_08545 [Plesiomonas shigelloides]
MVSNAGRSVEPYCTQNRVELQGSALAAFDLAAAAGSAPVAHIGKRIFMFFTYMAKFFCPDHFLQH